MNIISHFNSLEVCEIKLEQTLKRNIDGGNNAKLLLDNDNNKYIKIEFNTSKPNGDPIRVLDMTLAHKNKIKSQTSLEIGINETIKWYLENSESHKFKYNAFERK